MNNRTIKILSVVGARPNFMKMAPLIHAINRHNNAGLSPEVIHSLVHTGQHYDQDMSEKFFEELNIPPPDNNLGIGSGTHAEQVGRTMIAFEKVLDEPERNSKESLFDLAASYLKNENSTQTKKS